MLKMNNSIISVIIPMYNAQNYITKCLESILNQSEKNIEVIIVDDGSSDNSKCICEKIVQKDSRLKLLCNEKNMGVSATRNIGLNYAKGKYIYFADADDYLENNMFEIMLKHYTDDVDLVVCGHFINNIPQGNRNESIENFSRYEMATYIEGLKNYKFKGYLWNKLFKNDIIKNYSVLFDENISICEDSLFCHMYLVNCRRIVYSSLPLYHYMINKGSAVHSKINRQKMSIFDANRKILECCKFYNDETLNKLIKANYWSFNIGYLKKIVLNFSREQIVFGDIIYEQLRGKELVILRNQYISLKRKCLIFILRPIYKVRVIGSQIKREIVNEN